MTTRPRKARPATPAPGKLPLPELARDEAPRRQDRDGHRLRRSRRAARGRGRRRADPRRRHGGDGDARPRLDRAGDARRDDLPDARGHARGAPAARDRRPAVRLVRGLRRAGGRRPRSGWSRRAAPTPSSSRAPAAMLSRVRAIADVEHRGDGPHRPDAAVGDEARRLPGAGPHGGRAVQLYEDALALQAAGCFAIVLEAVPAPVAARITEALDDPDDRHRRRRRLRRPGARLARPARLYDGPHAAVRQALRRARREIGAALEQYAPTSASGAFPEEQHTYSIPDEELARFEAVARRRRAN